MADEEQTETEEKKFPWVLVGVIVGIVIILLLIFAFRNGEEIPNDIEEIEEDITEPISQDTTQVVIDVEETNTAETYCEEEGGVYEIGDEASTCTFKVLKKNAFPWFIEGFEAQGWECDEPEIDPETGEESKAMVPCYEITVYDAQEFYEENNLIEETEETIEEEIA